MHSIKEICERFGLSERAVRRRLTALGTLLDAELRRGDKNTVLLTDSGLAILDRVNQLQQSAGLGLSDAAGQVRNELANGHSVGVEQRANSAGQEDGALVRSLEARIQEQAQVIQFLQGQLETAQAQVRAMLPTVSEGRKHMGRLAALRYALMGR